MLSDRQALRQRVLRFLRKHQIPYDLQRQVQWYDGRTIPAGARVDPNDILHEAAHWLIAEPKRRGVVNYGLGPDPEGCAPLPSPVLVANDVDEEVMASAMGILLLARMGGPFARELERHSWDTTPPNDVKRDLEEAARLAMMQGVYISDEVVDRVLNACLGLIAAHRAVAYSR
ncbi:MAG: hypothetical protein AB7L09_02390 [Nitrospira sp.]